MDKKKAATEMIATFQNGFYPVAIIGGNWFSSYREVISSSRSSRLTTLSNIDTAFFLSLCLIDF
jgi:hypothetical protein